MDGMTINRHKSSSFTNPSPSAKTGEAYLCANIQQRQRQQFQTQRGFHGEKTMID